MNQQTEPTEPTDDSPRGALQLHNIPSPRGWGLAHLAPAGAAAWGARAIPLAGRPRELVRGTRRVLHAARPPSLDLLWDRQAFEGGTERAELVRRLNAPSGIAAAQKRYAARVRAGDMAEGATTDLVLSDDLVILALARGGYVYLGAWIPEGAR
jgi:hypothetical protein